MMKNTLKETRESLQNLGLPGGDLFSIPTSSKRFPDGAQYRWEVPGIQGPGSMHALLEDFDKRGLILHRVTQTKGIMTLADEEIQEMVDLAKKWQVELVLAVGPRSTYDTGAMVRTPEGIRMGYRLRGQEQIVRAIEDIKRATAIGCRSILLYDEGLLWVLNEMRKKEEIPPDTHFKVSAHCGHGNPCSAKLLENLGANTVNLVRDIQVEMYTAVRQAIDIPLDIHTENPASSGGFIRHYEIPEILRVAAPMYLKTGGSVAKTHSYETTNAEACKRAKQVGLVQRVIDTYYPEAIRSKRGPRDLAIPV
jgi:hypothetical protein